MEVVFYAVVIVLCMAGAYRLSRRPRYTAGMLKLANNHQYAYIFGDNLAAEAVKFNGMEVQLPHPLADFYLDAARDSKLVGPNMLFANEQRINLEGNFNNFFRLFVPKGTHVDVLSILSPDVMQTLTGTQALFDIHLHQDKLRLISPRSVYGMDAYEIDMLNAAQAVVAELEHRLVSWRPGTTTAELVYKKGKTLKFGPVYLRRSKVLQGLLLVLLATVLLGGALAFYYSHQNASFNDPYSKGPVVGTLIYAAMWIVYSSIIVIPISAVVWFMLHKDKAGDYIRALFGL